MLLDADERWQVDANALGLMHTDNPADAMYPHYRFQTHLGTGDVAVVQAMYGTRADSPAAQPPPRRPCPSC